MREYLIFQLVAAIGAMGEFGGHDRRGTLSLPGRSAVIGTLGAALGRRRDQPFADLEQLDIAVASFGRSAPLRDYHTVQTVPSAAVKAPQSRPEALREAAGNDKLNTTLTSRDYRCDCVFGVAVSGGDLPGLARALQRPAFQVYLGRKSCPLSAPFDPRIVAADNPARALTQLRLPPWIGARQMIEIVADEGTDLDAPARQETRHDRAIDRGLWHFGKGRYSVAHPEVNAAMVQDPGEGAP
ncbi:type I-E CRISPR-associated protein Cas5/CasD [Actibacterium sp.]|jgi:CRISPR system Cascade subunit CasD|uniref:type I-E CRISPR-associated protein Cas5/CasD n=1 Tax=Actibacterium sp. TaxID=1872125 RepID=UPI0006901FBD|nr:type I-E CRISPR-associated protein Cas5/CasD [Actibacterium sp.]|tara:strand:+ start:1233 stop:1955 length:723 start_codon:yes stop_codon:yes gene_type:complete